MADLTNKEKADLADALKEDLDAIKVGSVRATQQAIGEMLNIDKSTVSRLTDIDQALVGKLVLWIKIMQLGGSHKSLHKIVSFFEKRIISPRDLGDMEDIKQTLSWIAERVGCHLTPNRMPDDPDMSMPGIHQP